jgi:hypothetical protein
MQITRTSIATNVTRTIELPITEQQVDAYVNGALLQDAFPNLSADEREFFKTGITAEEWDAMFGEQEE